MARPARGGNSGLELIGEAVCPVGRGNQRAHHADHVKDLGDRALIEGVNGDPLADQSGDDVGLEIGEAENEVGTQIEDFPEVRRGERPQPAACRGAPREDARNARRCRRCGLARRADKGFRQSRR